MLNALPNAEVRGTSVPGLLRAEQVLAAVQPTIRNEVESGVRIVIAALLLLTSAECATTERIDPRNPGDRCLYSCTDGMRCVGTIFRKATSPLYGQCELEPHRCATSANCVGGDICVRFGSDIGVCRPVTFP